MGHDHDDQHSDTDAEKSSGGITGGDKSLSSEGTTSGGLGSGANAGTGGDVGNWDEGGSIGDAASATEGKEIVYPTGTGAAAVGDWSARQAGSGRESATGDTDEADKENDAG
ncbi:MAG: hypothetical protein ACR2GO_07595 [Candidatus Limnocylindria bacterium]